MIEEGLAAAGPFSLWAARLGRILDHMRERLKGHGVETGGPSDVVWNFEKFLIGRDGQVVGRFAPDITVDDPRIAEAIASALSSPA